MNASALATSYQPDIEAIGEWAGTADFNLQQVDCLIALMLKILDGKCNMDASTQYAVREIYRHAHRERSHLFDTSIHAFIEIAFVETNPLSIKHIHELRLFAESAIAKPVMKGFKQWLWQQMPGW